MTEEEILALYRQKRKNPYLKGGVIAALSIRFFTPYVRLAALDLMSQWDPVHPLVERLDRLTLAGCRHERLGLPNDADEATVVEVAKEACLQCRRERATAVSAAERQA